MSSRQELGESVVFESADYLGLGRRIVVLFVDFFAIVVVYVAMFEVVGRDSTWAMYHADAVANFVAFLYLVVLRRWVGSFGLWLMKAKLVDARGRSPTLAALTLRFLMLFFGPLHPGFDVWWAGTDPRHQTLRDKITQTYFIRKSAKPLGSVRQRFAFYSFLMWNFPVAEQSAGSVRAAISNEHDSRAGGGSPA